MIWSGCPPAIACRFLIRLHGHRGVYLLQRAARNEQLIRFLFLNDTDFLRDNPNKNKTFYELFVKLVGLSPINREIHPPIMIFPLQAIGFSCIIPWYEIQGGFLDATQHTRED